MAEQVSLSYINTTDNGINMIASWVKINSTGISFENEYSFFYPFIGLSLIFVLSIMSMIAYNNIPQKYKRLPNNERIYVEKRRVCVLLSILYGLGLFLSIMTGFIESTDGPVTGEYIKYCLGERCRMNPAHIKMLNSKSIRRNMFHSEMNNLVPNSTYMYQLGSNKNGWSKEYTFMTLDTRMGRDRKLSLAVYGDLGLSNAKSLNQLISNLDNDRYQMVLHMGDYAYNLYSNDGCIGDQFMNMIEPIASKVPYMTSPGNHEEGYNFTYYTMRFNMPGKQSGSNNNMYYSFDVGDIHFTSISSEIYYYDNDYNNEHLIRQYNWLKADLENAQNSSWRIMYSHRPMYCSMDIDDTTNICTSDPEKLRDGTTYKKNTERVAPLEHLLMDYNVDLFLSGHLHNYERLWPTYRYQLLQKNYNKPKGPVHIISGTAGCNEGNYPFDKIDYPFSAFRSNSYGFGLLDIYNNHQLRWSQVSAKDSSVIDSIIINK